MLSLTAFDTDEIPTVAGVYTVVYTPDVTLAADSVKADNFYLTSQATSADVREAYYYPENGCVKLTVFAITTDEDAPLTLNLSEVRDIEGYKVETEQNVYLLEETEIEEGTLGVQSFRFFSEEQAISDITNRKGVSVLVGITNATGSRKTGNVSVYDGEILCGKAEFSVKNEGVCWLTVACTAHTFSSAKNVRFVVE